MIPLPSINLAKSNSNNVPKNKILLMRIKQLKTKFKGKSYARLGYMWSQDKKNYYSLPLFGTRSIKKN